MGHLTQCRAAEVLSYCPETGVLRWKSRHEGQKAWNRRFSGKKAGANHGDGYLSIAIDGVRYLAHRIIWLMSYGFMPSEIDHIDQNRSNNRLSNLRAVSRLENNKNHTLQRNNTSGCVGVYWNKKRGMWRAYVYLGKKQKHLGHFREIDDAIRAREAANDRYRFHPNHGRAA